VTEPIPESAARIEAIRRDLDSLYQFARRMEHNLQHEIRELKQPPADRDRPAADDGVWKLSDRLPYLYRGSALLTILGFFEHNLNAVCESLRKEHGVTTGITDLPGRGLRRSKLYITKHIGLPFPSDSESWGLVLKYADIRNLIAHRDSLVKDDDPELIRFIEADPHLSIDETRRVRLHEGALIELLDHLHRFFQALSESIRGAPT
jgi:hypothetical protein